MLIAEYMLLTHEIMKKSERPILGHFWAHLGGQAVLVLFCFVFLSANNTFYAVQQTILSIEFVFA